jgi:putative oxidoreductase
LGSISSKSCHFIGRCRNRRDAAPLSARGAARNQTFAAQKRKNDMDTGLLLIRLALGLTLAAHGAQKLSRAFGGHGLAGSATVFESLGFRPGKPLALLAGLGEGAGGLALAFGLFTPLAAAVIFATMLVAVFGVHWEKGFFSQQGGYEFPLVLGVTAVGLAFTGPGRWSLDAFVGLPFAGLPWGAAAIGLGVLGALPPLVLRSIALQRNTARVAR